MVSPRLGDHALGYLCPFGQGHTTSNILSLVKDSTFGQNHLLMSVLTVGLSFVALGMSYFTLDAQFPCIQRQSYHPIKTLALIFFLMLQPSLFYL